jgi:hypothetical protein
MKFFRNKIDVIKALGGMAQSALGCEEHRKGETVCIYNMVSSPKGNCRAAKLDGEFFGGRLAKWWLESIAPWASGRMWSAKEISNGEFRVSNGEFGESDGG